MAKKNESTMQWKVDIAGLTKSMQDAKRQISLANAEFKNATAGMKDWQTSASGLESKLSQLKKTYDAQNTTLDLLNKKYEITVRELGEASPEAQKLKIQIQNQEAAVKNTAAQMDEYNAKLKTAQKEAAAEETELAKLTKKVSEQETEMKELTDEYKNAVIQYGKNSDEAKELAEKISDLSGELKENKDKLSDADEAADDLTGALGDAKGASEETGDGFTVMKGVLADLASEAIQAVVEGLKDMAKYAKEAWKEFDDGADAITKLTGATGADAEALQESYKKVAKSINADLTDVGTAIGQVSTKFGSTGEDLEELSTLFLKFAEINDADVSGSIADVQKAMAAYGLGTDDAAAFLDRLSYTAQATGVSTNDLTSGIVSNATAFQELGLNIDQAVALMGQLEKSGANSETVLNGMRKALKNSAADGVSLSDALSQMQSNIANASDSTDGLTAAYDLFGKSGDQIYGAIKNGTLNFNELGVAAEDATDTVNKTFEATLDAPDELALGVQGLKVDIATTADEVIKKYSPQIKKAINSITQAVGKLIPKVAELIGWIVDNGDTITAIIAGIAAAILAMKTASIIMGLVSAFSALFTAVQAGIPIMTALNMVLNANPIGIIIGLIAGLVAAFVVLWNKSEEFRNFFIGMWEAIKETLAEYIDAIVGFFTSAWEAIKAVWETVTDFFAEVFAGIKAAFDTAVEFFTGIFTDAWNGIKGAFESVSEFFGGVWENITGAFGSVVEWFSGIFTDAWDAVETAFDGVKTFFEGIWTDIKDVFGSVEDWFTETFTAAKEAVETIFDGLVELIKAPINAIIDGINLFIEGLNKIQIPDWVPAVGGKGLDFDTIPNLAQGGVLAKGQLGLLEGDGAEAVVPLERNTQWISRVAEQMQSALGFGGLVEALTEVADALKISATAMNHVLSVDARGSGSGTGSGRTQNITFNQTINSPKALDRMTVYRNTNDLLFTAKVRMNNV